MRLPKSCNGDVLLFSDKLPEKADVVIIGCGVVGCAIARELSRYKLDVVAIDKEPDVGWGASKGNMGVVHPFVPHKGKYKNKMCIEGNKLFEELAKELDFPFQRPGLLIVALSFVQFLALVIAYIYLRVIKKVKAEWVWRGKLRELEPRINKKARAAILVPTAGITDPVKYAIALAENAAANGVKFVLNTHVIGFEIENGRIKAVITDKGKIRTRFVINAAGVYSDEIERLAGIKKRRMWHGKGVMIVFDPILRGHYSHIMAPMPLKVDPRTKGGAISISPDGTPMWGPNLVEAEGKEDTAVDSSDLKMIVEKFRALVPDFPVNTIMKYYAGVRPVDEDSWDFVLGPTEVKGFINAAYILSPGLTASYVIAKKVVDFLREEGLELVEKENFVATRRDIKGLSRMSMDEIDEAIKENASYGRIICLCNNVSEAEIREAIRRGARTVDSIKFRTGAGKGRCQGCRCLPEIVRILSEELGVSVEKITIRGEGSEIFR